MKGLNEKNEIYINVERKKIRRLRVLLSLTLIHGQNKEMTDLTFKFFKIERTLFNTNNKGDEQFV